CALVTIESSGTRVKKSLMPHSMYTTLGCGTRFTTSATTRASRSANVLLLTPALTTVMSGFAMALMLVTSPSYHWYVAVMESPRKHTFSPLVTVIFGVLALENVRCVSDVLGHPTLYFASIQSSI